MNNRIQPLGAAFRTLEQRISAGAPGPRAPAADPVAAGDSLALSSPAPSASKAQSPGVVTTQPGETLMTLAARHLGHAGRWQELYALNRQAVGTNPNLLWPGTKLRLPAIAADPAPAAGRIAEYAKTRAIGEPVDNGGGPAAHDWHGLVVQDFAGGADTEGRAMVVDGPEGPHLVRNGFYKTYLADNTHMKLGAPLEDEHWEGDAVVQRFERGEMRWKPNGQVAVKTALDAGRPAAPQPSPASPAPNPAPAAPAPSPGVSTSGRPLALNEYPAANPVGAHGIPNYLQNSADVDFVLGLLERTGAKNTNLIVPFPNPAELRDVDREFLRKAKERGVTVQLRLGFDCKPGAAVDAAALERYTRQVAEVSGHGPYIAIANEPNLAGEWANGKKPDAQTFARWWAPLAKAVASGGGYPGLPGLAAGAYDTPDGNGKQEFSFYQRMLETLAAEAPEALNRAWTGAHPYHMYAGAGHPDYVEDANWQLGRYNAMNEQILGRSLPVLVTESGYVDGENPRRLDPGNADQARDVARFKASLAQRPDWLVVGTADWLLTNRHGEGWHSTYGPNGEGTAWSRVLEAEKGKWEGLRDEVRS